MPATSSCNILSFPPSTQSSRSKTWQQDKMLHATTKYHACARGVLILRRIIVGKSFFFVLDACIHHGDGADVEREHFGIDRDLSPKMSLVVSITLPVPLLLHLYCTHTVPYSVYCVQPYVRYPLASTCYRNSQSDDDDQDDSGTPRPSSSDG